ncbi:MULTISPECIES: GAF and ANTAR domain-containing protein [Arthrobacter]|uniref:GAF and ANTAR domain-containing protein n=1 Tax=Arthrobacter caoxuetaonis TaxID=2886935 RepID=A0A9X1MCP6_9MICC|nr:MULTISPECIES: GAF and ANTAR domain-containing protein [Arthrobacter]MCC3282291.1 GAF and ANTAR domain-containing protein [Arthrobacter caoxuetaonis]MCC3297321.1 GAF and ANTAR domain-containing protein [Arthrobacter caoxuetaonis]MCC9194210.1 GAF and ANTAR domain-containing protein [Arthrobacter sp. zg-Y916]USQ58131.1 GAF and ANTAR domain-containing protein [Arthrobacter caoxuetaonis]
MVTQVQAEHAAAFQDLLLCADGLEAYLAELAVLAVAIAGAAEVRGCSIVIERPRRKRVAGDSDARAARLAEPVFAAGGPGAEAITGDTSVVVTDAWTETRRGAFPGTAAVEGLRSMAAVPLALEDGARGVLCFYSPRQHLFQPAMLRTAERIAAEASGTLCLALRIDGQMHRARNLQAALESRTVVDLAVGIIMGQNGCSQQAAVEILRSVSNTRNVKIRSVAAGVVAAVSERVSTHFDE